MNLKETINKVRLQLGMTIIEDVPEEKIQQQRCDSFIAYAQEICEADDVEFDEQIVFIQDNEEFDTTIETIVVQIPVREEGPLSKLKDTFSRIGIKATRNTYCETIENRQWEEKKKLINELCDSEYIDFEVSANITLIEDEFKVDLKQRIVPAVCKDGEFEDENLNADDDIFLTLNIDSEAYEKKPDKKQIGAIQKRIGMCKRTITVEEFIQAIENGSSFKAAALNGNKNADWESQQVFALDIDNDEASIKKYGLLTAEEACNRFINLGVPPAFYYDSFSSTEERPKFRLIFIVKNPVTDIRVRNTIQMALMNIMPEADKSCKDLSRLFFGTDKKCTVIYNKQYLLDPYVLIQSMVSWLKAKYSRSKNEIKHIKTYCERVGLNMINGLPNVQIAQDDKNYGNSARSIIYNIENVVNPYKNIVFHFSIDEKQAYTITKECKGKKNLKRVTITSEKIKYNELIRNFPFHELETNRCKLWADFITGNRWCYHREVFGIACNMWRVEGAEQKMLNIIESNPKYRDKSNKIYTIKQCNKYGYAPMRCENFCPYHDSCSNQGYNMLHSIDNKRGQIRMLKEDVAEILSIEDGVEKLQEAILDAFNTNEDNITVIKAPTGIGKTEALKHLNSYDNTVIAYPNHKLGSNIVERLNIHDSIYMKELELEDKNILNEFRRLQKIGAYKQARQYIEQYRELLLQECSEKLASDIKKGKELNRINEYLLGIKQSKNTSKLIFCTHRKALEIDNNNIDTYIIDEDIVASTIISTMNVNVSEIEELIAACEKINACNTREQLDILRTNIIKARVETNMPVILPKFKVNKDEIDALIELKRNSMKINLKELMNIKVIMADENGRVLGMLLGELPRKRCIILSATANEIVYRRLFPDRKINFIDIGNIHSEGQVLLHYTGCSRSKLNKDFNGILNQIKTEASGTNNIITFMKFEDKFKEEGFDAITHFGACSGLDSYKGQDLIVAGTPHADERVYRLLAATIAGKVEEHEKISYINTRRNGFEFYFNTYEEGSLLQEIQFYYIESELVQAIGRARVLRTDATVHVFSNYPVRGAVLYDKKIS